MDTSIKAIGCRFGTVSLRLVLALVVFVICQGRSQTVGNGDGLLGSYFDNRDLSGAPVAERVEAQVDFDWGLRAPAGIAYFNEFSVRWTGELQAQYSEAYTLFVDSVDGTRVWLNEQLIIDDWRDRPAAEASATVNLVAGQRYLLRVEYCENHLYPGIRLRWSSPSTAKQIIPQSQLYAVPTDADSNGLADLWELAHFGRVGVDPNGDDDGDGLTNLEEYRRWSDPRDPLHNGVPNEWAHGDLGAALGDASYSNGVFTVSSMGRAAPNDLWGGADAFHYLYQPVEGNAQVVARVLGMNGQAGVSGPARVGLMVRLTLHDNSPCGALIGFGTNSPIFRTGFGVRNIYLPVPAVSNAPLWIKGVRWSEASSGYDSVTCYSSPDGTNWTQVAVVETELGLVMPRRIYVGLVVASPQPGTLVSAQFDHVSVAPVTAADVQAGTPVVGTGDGLTGCYYANTNLAGTPVTTRVDPLLNFDWGKAAPSAGMNHEYFSVSWIGEIQAQYTEPYTFYMKIDDGVRVRLNDELIIDKWVEGINNSSATVNLKAGQRYLLDIEYYQARLNAQARLWWSSPSTPKRIVPQSQLYSQFTDTDHDGLPDLWEIKYFGDLRYGPNDDPDKDGLTNLQEYRLHTNPNNPDTDGDGMPDGWEVAHGLNPLDPSDAARDNDYDGLTNLQEYQLGTDPNNPDTDGDGIPDGLEVDYLHTDPLKANPGLVTEVMKVPGAQGTNFLGRWAVEGKDLYGLDRRGSVDFVLSNVRANKYLLQIEGTQNIPHSPVSAMELVVWLDGENLGHRPLNAAYGTNGIVEYVTPFLARGKHTVRVFWDGAASLSSLRLKEVRLERIGGPDRDRDGITDWVEAMLHEESGRDTNAPASSYVSPMCLEGRDPYLSLMSLNIKSGRDQAQWPIQRNAGKRWYANVPLQTNGSTAVRISYQNGAVVERHLLGWEPFNVLTHATSSVPALTIRKDDSLLLTALPAGRPAGDVSIAVSEGGRSVAQYRTTTKEPAPFQFTNAGDYTVSATYTPKNRGTPVTGGVSVRVVDHRFPENPVCWAGKARDWALTNVPSGITLEGDGRLQLTAQTNADPNIQALSLLIDQNDPRTLVSRLGANGPIVAAVRADGLRLFGTPDTYNKLIQTYPDGSRLVETMAVLSPVLTNVTVQISIIVGGVTFDDGTIYRELKASDFDVLGQCVLRFLMATDVETANCHRLVVMQGAAKVGNY
jgi:PA14 domain/Bacterial TSP3 repeat